MQENQNVARDLRKQTLLIVIVVGSLFGLASFAVWGRGVFTENESASSAQAQLGDMDVRPLVFRDEATRFQAVMPAGIEQSPLSEEDNEQHYLARFTAPPTSKEQFLITVRKEAGFNVISSVSGKSALEVALDTAGRSFPGVYPQYEEIRQQQFNLGGVNAAEMIFTYDSPAGERAQQQLLVLARNNDEVVYLSFQALERDFDAVDAAYFEPIRNSISFE